jgi:hypothetical protein
MNYKRLYYKLMKEIFMSGELKQNTTEKTQMACR